MSTHTTLKGVGNTGQSLVSDILETNLVNFFQWGFLGVGGFFNINIPTSGCYGGELSRLRPVSDPRYTDGQVWEGFRKDWVWETGVEFSTQPIRVSGVYVNNQFIPLNSGVTIDYPNGRIILPSAVSQTGVVKAEFSYRLFQIYTADHPAWQKVQINSFRPDSPDFLQKGSGNWDVLAENRVQLPALFVESVPRTNRRGLQLGGGTIVEQDVLFHVLSEQRWHYKWLHDAITAQWEKRINGFDKNKLLDDDKFPLDEYGSPNPSGLMYPQLANGDGPYFWEQIRFSKISSVDQPKLGDLHYCTVRATMELDRPE